MRCKNNRVFEFILFFTIIAFYIGIALPNMALAGERRETDLNGKMWSLGDWTDGTRPYPKDLKEREEWYKQRWGENWAGPLYTNDAGEKYDISPGIWDWDEFVVIPNGKSHWFGKSQALVYAPGGSEEVTDVYALVKYGLYHIDPITKDIVLIGSTSLGGIIDGLDTVARMEPVTTSFGGWATVDPVTGRVYFAQNHPDGGEVLRYVEKLLPYKDSVSGSDYWLPAYLDYNDMYLQLTGPDNGALSKVMNGANRVKPKFAVRTTSVRFDDLPQTSRSGGFGARVLLSQDGKQTFVEMDSTWPNSLNNIHAFDIQSGTDIGSIIIPNPMPSGTGQVNERHEVLSSRYDNHIYIAKHTGSMGGPGRMFRFNVQNGALEMLYDSLAFWEPTTVKRPSGWTSLRSTLNAHDTGPGDANTLSFSTTNFQVQSPRTGAILNGGWDGSGIRRYHDGFSTALVKTYQNFGEGETAGRPEWGIVHNIANFGSLMSPPDVAPNGDLYLTSSQDERVYSDSLRVNGIRIVRLSRTDWPAEQPVNGYANQYLSPTQRHILMLEYAQRYIANSGWNGIPAPDSTPPSIPQSLNANEQSDSKINLSWQASSDPESGVAKYIIYRNGIKVGESSITSYSDTGLIEAITYTFEISAVNGVGDESGKSTPVSATTLSDTAPPYIVSTNTNGYPAKVFIVFSESLDKTSAENIFNYAIDNGIIISGALLDVDQKTVYLTTSSHSEDISYLLTLNNIKDEASIPNTIALNTISTYTFVDKIVKNLTVTNAKIYSVQENLQIDDLVYYDRAYTFSNIPASLQGSTYIQTSNDDKGSTGTSFITFNVEQDITVYVAHDNRITSKPSWLASFIDTGTNLITTDSTLRLFARSYPAGTVTLGGNGGSGSVSMYSIIITTQEYQPTNDTIPPRPPTGLIIGQ